MDRSSSSLIDLFVAITLLFDTLLFANCRILHQKTYVETLNHNHVIYTLEAVFLEKIYIDVHTEEIRHKLAVHTVKNYFCRQTHTRESLSQMEPHPMQCSFTDVVLWDGQVQHQLATTQLGAFIRITPLLTQPQPTPLPV